MDYLVTGACGFIGHNVAQQLLESGHRVIGLDNMNDAYDVRLKEWRLGQLRRSEGFAFHQVDITNLSATREVLEELKDLPAAVFNLAARAGVPDSVKSPQEYYRTNVEGTINLLELTKEFKINKFIQASTSSLYGNRNKVPFSETDDTNEPLSPYSASKKGTEVLCHAYHHLYGIDITIFRYFTVYGPAGRPDMSPFRFVQWIYERQPVTIYGDGTQSRDFTYVTDVAAGTILGLNAKGFNVLNLGNNEPITLNEMVRIIEEFTGHHAVTEFHAWQPTDMKKTWANIDKIRETLGWSPRVRFRDGMEQLIDWYKDNREWASQIHT